MSFRAVCQLPPRTAETLLYNTSKRSNLSRAGGANAAAKAADLPLASQEEEDEETNEYAGEESGGEDGEKLTQGSLKLPSDESFHDILDSVDGGCVLLEFIVDLCCMDQSPTP